MEAAKPEKEEQTKNLQDAATNTDTFIYWPKVGKCVSGSYSRAALLNQGLMLCCPLFVT